MYPTISIITASYNTNLSLVTQCLEGLKKQDYPKSKIEHIVMEGGSSNGSIERARSYGCTVIVLPDLVESTQRRIGRGVLRAKGDIILFLEFDNIILNTSWLKQMVRPLWENKGIVGAFSAWNTASRDMPIFTRYCALFGMNDPVVYYLGKSEKLTQFESTYTKGKILKRRGEYDIVEFDQTTLPTLGDNGHMVKAALIRRVVNKPEDFIHTDVFARLCRKGENTYAVVYNAIVHHTGNSLWQFARRRAELKATYFDPFKTKRDYLVFDRSSSRDRKHIFLFSFVALTFVEPLSQSIRGFLTKPDLAWFIHPVACFVLFLIYVRTELSLTFRRLEGFGY